MAICRHLYYCFIVRGHKPPPHPTPKQRRGSSFLIQEKKCLLFREVGLTLLKNISCLLSLFLTAVFRNNSHTKKFTYLKICKPVFVSSCTHGAMQPSHQSKLFSFPSPPKRKPHTTLMSLPFLLPLSPSQPQIYFLSVAHVGTADKGWPAVYGLSCLASITQHHTFGARSCCMNQNFILLGCLGGSVG